jgi:3-deoxy-D-manno-octulosonic-acid transferase
MMSGNLKFDVRAAGDSEAVRLLGKLRGGLRLVVAGSTLEGEEAMLLQAWPALLAADPNLGMVLAPRHPERFAAVEELLQRAGFPWRKRSSLRDAALIPGEIVLLDSIGELASIYSLAAVAFIGGSLVAEGGHNPLEPAQFGVPVVMGEHYANFRSIVEAMRSQEAIAIASSDRFAEAVASLLRDPEAAAQMGERGRQVFEQQAGATQRTVAALREILSRKGTA